MKQVIGAFLLSIFLLLPSFAHAETLTRPLYIGAKGSDVSYLQTFLQAKGYFTYPTITGFFGNITWKAVADFQTANNLERVGNVGPLTRALINGSFIASSSTDIVSSSGTTTATTTVPSLIAPIPAASSTTFCPFTFCPTGNYTPGFGGGGGAAVVLDTAAPTVTLVSTSTTGLTATIVWNTDENATSRVDYGTTASYGTASSSSALTTSHTIYLSGLAPSTTYHFRITSIDSSNNVAVTSDAIFTTVADSLVLSAPSGFTLSVPFAITRTESTNTFTHNFDPTSFKPTPTVTVYVGAGGDNTRDCLSWANRCRSLKQGLVKANAQSAGVVVRVLAQAGIYRATNVDGTAIPDDWGGQNPQRSVVIEPADGSGNALPSVDGRYATTSQIISIHDVVLTFAPTSDPNIYVADYDNTVQKPGQSAFDLAHLNSFGRPQSLRYASNIESTVSVGTNGATLSTIFDAINAYATQYGVGATFRDITNKKFYVRLSDNRVPDSNLVISQGNDSGSTGRNFFMNPSGSNNTLAILARNVDMWGGYSNFRSLGNVANNNVLNITQVDSYMGYSNSTSRFMDHAGTTTCVRCVVSDTYQDGYTYSISTGTTKQQFFFEMDSFGSWIGNNRSDLSVTPDASTNVSTAHQYVRGVRINNTYSNATNRIIHDIEDAQTWNLGLTVGPSRQTGTQAAAVASGYLPVAAVDTTQVWVDGMRFTTPLSYGLEAYDGGIIYVRNTNEGGLARDINGGTIVSY